VVKEPALLTAHHPTAPSLQVCSALLFSFFYLVPSLYFHT